MSPILLTSTSKKLGKCDNLTRNGWYLGFCQFAAIILNQILENLVLGLERSAIILSVVERLRAEPTKLETHETRRKTC